MSFGHEQYPDKTLLFLQALGGVLLWIKLLYFLRASKTIGWMVRLVLDVISDMKIFLLLVIIMVIAFTDAFYTLGKYDQITDGVELDNWI